MSCPRKWKLLTKDCFYIKSISCVNALGSKGGLTLPILPLIPTACVNALGSKGSLTHIT